jgi:protein phosphatase
MSDDSPNWSDPIQYAAMSDIGLRRTNNQDAYIALPAEDEDVWLSRGHMFVVADGMGAHAAGELASKLAVEGVVHHYRKLRQMSPPEAILKALRDTNSEIHQRGQANSEFHNMGTTCSVLVLLPQGALVAHVGDSRVYRVRGLKTEQLTFDHSLVWEMRAAGSGVGQDLPLNIPKNVITRSLGPQAGVQVDLEGPLDVQEGDTFLLCSDGLTGRVDDDEIGVVVGHLPPHEAAQFLVDLANVRGGPDNTTVIIVRASGRAAQSRHWRGEPLIVGQELRPPATVHPLAWVAIALGGVLAIGFALVHFYWLALLALGVAVVAGLVPWWQSRPSQDGVALTAGRRLGQAPYAQTECEQLRDEVAGIAQRVGEAIEQQESARWADGHRAQVCLAEAQSKIRHNEPVEGLRLLAVALRLLAQRLSDA